ncbi:oligopeptide ABC transporter permease OppB [Thiothrix subterranea]|uniref:Oligopeptide ABC transporter permease OppB n=1 Tax=Thiothrix subterranea TaxID=2735563 RepID=A0AA51QY04_9GAMM|nr:oligopeptide ABC transporter permease OppB [Thiothrix subterranea]MDQ5767655.1 oligopeptide ABC transporter permease OppB [Thiothrix subterranea]WML85462.1 oligopeptide ABC transporter permease OppB [Thiothrix subterranea]
MLQYVVKRLLGALPTLLVIITLAFFLIRLAPGGPFDTERPMPPEIAANMERAYHLDRPLPVQYGYYLLNVLQGDLGPSFKYKDHSVSSLIAEGFPVSLQLGVFAMLLALLIGIPAGMLAALHHNRALDHAVMAVSMTGITVPNFVMAPLLALVFGVFLHWLPVAGWDQGWKSAVLPVIALALPQIAYAARLIRASVLETLSSPHIRTAVAKGLPLRLIVWRHVLKGALLPVLSWLGPATAAIITGSVVIEQIFGIPGIGRHFVQGALNRDYTLVMGVVIFYGVLIILMNLLVDVIYGWMDPRVRYD